MAISFSSFRLGATATACLSNRLDFHLESALSRVTTQVGDYGSFERRFEPGPSRCWEVVCECVQVAFFFAHGKEISAAPSNLLDRCTLLPAMDGGGGGCVTPPTTRGFPVLE